MDHKDQVAAANALIQWFNSQDISPADATLVMSKVVAKVLAGRDREGERPRVSAHDLADMIDAFTYNLVHDINEHLYNVRRTR
jgi:hypothetical protein